MYYKMQGGNESSNHWVASHRFNRLSKLRISVTQTERELHLELQSETEQGRQKARLTHQQTHTTRRETPPAANSYIRHHLTMGNTHAGQYVTMVNT